MFSCGFWAFFLNKFIKDPSGKSSYVIYTLYILRYITIILNNKFFFSVIKVYLNSQNIHLLITLKTWPSAAQKRTFPLSTILTDVKKLVDNSQA